MPGRDRPTALRPGHRRLRGAQVSRAARRSSLALAAALAVRRPPRRAPTAERRRTPIEHFIFLMQENHTFDNYFGTYPGRGRHPADDVHAASTRRARRRAA